MITIIREHNSSRRELSHQLKRLQQQCGNVQIWLAAFQWFLYTNDHERQLEFMSNETKAALKNLGVI